MIAEAANPEWISVPLVGWSHAEALHRRFGAVVATSVRNREAIERFGWREGEQFLAIDTEALARPLWRLSQVLEKYLRLGFTMKTALELVGYYWFEKLLLRRVDEQLRSGAFDLVHRITPLSPVIPSLHVSRRCRQLGIPFVLGPLNGGLPWPKEFRSVRWREGEILGFARGATRVLPGQRSTRRNASVILAASRATLKEQPTRYRDKCLYLPENAIDPARFHLQGSGPRPGPLQVVFVGRLVPCKGLDMLLDAAAPLITSGRLELTLIGDGSERRRLEAQAERLGLRDPGLQFAGWMEHTAVQERVARSQVMAFPSVHDFGGGVVLEAMALGVPALVLDYGGPAELATPDTGYLVPMAPREQVVQGLREGLEAITADPADAHAKGQRARRRVHELFTWDAKAEQMAKVYDWALGRGDKPDLGFAGGGAEQSVADRLAE